MRTAILTMSMVLWALSCAAAPGDWSEGSPVVCGSPVVREGSVIWGLTGAMGEPSKDASGL